MHFLIWDTLSFNVGPDLDPSCLTLVARKGTCDNISRLFYTNRPKFHVVATVDPAELAQSESTQQDIKCLFRSKVSGHKISGVTSTVNIMTKFLVYYNNYYALNNFSRKAISFMKTLRNTMIKHICKLS